MLLPAGKGAGQIGCDRALAFLRNRTGDQEFFELTALLQLPQTDTQKPELLRAEAFLAADRYQAVVGWNDDGERLKLAQRIAYARRVDYVGSRGRCRLKT